MEPKPLKRKIITTKDGSQTIFIPELNENYHSVNGAVQESMHVFINAGLKLFENLPEIKIFEVGFGTGLNALVTYNYLKNKNGTTLFHSVEKYPINEAEYSVLKYPHFIETSNNIASVFEKMHSCNWNETIAISSNFQLKKIDGSLSELDMESDYNIIYFDAFAPEVQPDLWTVDVFKKMYNSLAKGGILVTYSAKGQVRRNMQNAGFSVEKIPGPPGKREMLRATKI